VYKQIMHHIAQDIYPFHMPGHKRNSAFFPPNLQDLDVTEIPGMDVLSHPTGMIQELQQKIANFYGASDSFLLVNGSSAGLVAAICATCTDGSPLIVPRNANTSIYNGMALSGAAPQYIMPQITPDGLAGGISPSAFDDMPYGATALVVSPTYEGFVSDIATIAEKVHARGGILIVDEAHGAHFAFHKAFPQSALQLGADIVVQSLHKTLPAPSQCAVLHIGKTSKADISRIKFHVNALQTSSPSYILMSVCDFMLHKLWENPKYFDEYVARLENLRAALPCAKDDAPLRLSGMERIGTNAIFDVDISKLLFTSYTAVTGEEIAEIMAKEHKVQMEMANDRHILAMTSVADRLEGFERLKIAVDAVIATRITSVPVGANCVRPNANCALPEVALTPRQALALPSQEIPWEESAGRISAQLVANYPPGIAIIAPGERIPANMPKHAEIIRVSYNNSFVGGCTNEQTPLLLSKCGAKFL